MTNWQLHMVKPTISKLQGLIVEPLEKIKIGDFVFSIDVDIVSFTQTDFGNIVYTLCVYFRYVWYISFHYQVNVYDSKTSYDIFDA